MGRDVIGHAFNGAGLHAAHVEGDRRSCENFTVWIVMVLFPLSKSSRRRWALHRLLALAESRGECAGTGRGEGITRPARERSGGRLGTPPRPPSTANGGDGPVLAQRGQRPFRLGESMPRSGSTCWPKACARIVTLMGRNRLGGFGRRFATIEPCRRSRPK
jgi:hypothetical protein